jgi:hypothetical protein
MLLKMFLNVKIIQKQATKLFELRNSFEPVTNLLLPKLVKDPLISFAVCPIPFVSGT